MNKRGFTLIELLIVVAIIAILAAIAVPNFLEAQTRGKVARAKSDMRTLATGVASYRVDYDIDPEPLWTSGGDYDRIWLGFVSWQLTTPVSYLTSVPADVFPENFLASAWVSFAPNRNNYTNQPYVHMVRVNRRDNGNEIWHMGKLSIQSMRNANRRVDIDSASEDLMENSPSVFISAGPDDALTMPGRANNGLPFAVYDPSNGTTSDGDIIRPEN